MRTSARLSIAASLLAISFAAACSDSTGPRQQTAAQVAAHFDSIAIRATAQSDTNEAYGTRSFLTSLIELPAALGALPATVSVTTGTGVESWKSYELLEIPAAGSSNDSSFAILMFRDADAHTALIAFFDGAGAIQEAGIVTGDTILVSPNGGSATTSLTSVSTTCTTPSSSLLNPQLTSFTVGTCTLARFRTSLALTSPTTPGADAGLTNLSFSNATMNGVRVVDPGTTVQRVHAIFRAVSANRRH